MSGITPIGATAVTGTVSSIALPPGCAAGDWVLVVGNGLLTGSFSLAGSSPLQASTQYTSSGTAAGLGLLEYTLTSADVTAGALPVSSNLKVTTLVVFRGVNATPIDQQSAMATTTAAKPVVITATGVTTTNPNDTLVFVGAVGALGGGAVGGFTQQSGFTSASDQQNSTYATTVAYAPQAAVGPSGNVTCTWSNNNFGQSGAVLLALAPAGGGSGNTATIGGALGALACAATVSAALAASVAAGIGPNATAATTSATDAAGVTGALNSLATTAHGNGSQAAAVAGSFGGMGSSLTSTRIQALAVSADFGPLASSLTVSAITGTNTAAIASALGALSSSLTVTAHAGINTASIAATLPALGTSGTVSALASAAAASAVGPLASGAATAMVGVAQIHASLGPLMSALTTGTAAATLPVDENYIVTLPARAFYAALPARNFYVLDTSSMTGSFETKDPRETVVLTFDASAGLASGETLTEIASTDVTMASGTDPDASKVVVDPQINTAPITVNGKTLPTGTAVQAEAVGGVNPARYLIAITCNTSNPDKVLTLKGILPVSSS